MLKKSIAAPPGERLGNRPGRPAYLKQFRERLRAIFPREALAEELTRRNLTAVQAARQAGVPHSPLYQWLDGSTAPRADVLVRFLDSLGIDREPYQAFLETQAPVRLVCPHCGAVRTIGRGKLGDLTRRAHGREALPQRADGAVEYACHRCAAQVSGHALMKREARRQLKARLGERGPKLEDAAKQGDLGAKTKLGREKADWMSHGETREQAKTKLLAYARHPKTETHRRAMGVSAVVDRARRPSTPMRRAILLRLCPLCGLIVHRREWHWLCWLAWGRWYRAHVTACRVPPATARPDPLRSHGGPNPATHLARNYHWLLARRSGSHRRTLLTSGGNGSAYKSTVTRGIASFLALLPGSWDLVFTSHPRGNAARQALVPLPLEMHQVVGAADRDPLIRRLLEYGMPEQDIARLTGMEASRVRGLALNRTAEPAA